MGRSVTIEEVIEVKDFEMVWDFLERKFGYSKKWRQDCEKFIISRQDRKHASHVKDFLYFGQKDIQPLLNAALCRQASYPTWMRLLRWLLRDRIAEKNNIANQFRNQGR